MTCIALACRRIVSFLWKEYVGSVGSTSALKKELKSAMDTILPTKLELFGPRVSSRYEGGRFSA